MSEFYIPPKNKKVFQDIYFAHLERILEITKYEFTGGYAKQVVAGNNVSTEYVSDKKEEYCQVVEAMACILHGYFDDDIKKAYNSYLKEIATAFKKHYDGETLKENSPEDYRIYSRKRLRLTTQLFMDLCDFGKRKQHFTGISFTDEEDEDDEGIIDEEIKGDEGIIDGKK